MTSYALFTHLEWQGRNKSDWAAFYVLITVGITDDRMAFFDTFCQRFVENSRNELGFEVTTTVTEVLTATWWKV
jgi:hypothetical protein